MSASPSYTEAIVVAPQKTVYAVNGSINTTDTTVPCDQNDLRVYEQNVWGEMSELAPGTGGYTISPTGSLNTEGTNTVTITAAGSSGGDYHFRPAQHLMVKKVELGIETTPAPASLTYKVEDDSTTLVSGHDWTDFDFPTTATLPTIYTITVTSAADSLSASYDVFVSVNILNGVSTVIVYKSNGGG